MTNSAKNFILLLLLLAFPVLLPGASSGTTTPIKHVIVIFQENRSFDHYFGTYPNAENNPGETVFRPRINTPSVNGLSGPLLDHNQNSAQPFRLSPGFAAVDTNNPGHKYTVLQQACHAGLMDKFVEFSGKGLTPPSVVMGHYDGNTVTAYWNYAQYFSMSDNYHATNIGGSTAGAINLISGNTHGASPEIPDSVVSGTLINDVDPVFDRCSSGSKARFSGINIGNLLNAGGVTWGFFQGGFADCSAKHAGPEGPFEDYIPHHNPFQYYKSTSNPEHLPPTSLRMIGRTDQANHLYDLNDFWKAVGVGNLPEVSFLRAPAYQDGHGGYSSPLLEQTFIVSTINRLQQLPEWNEMVIVVAYDDPGGWYDHEMPVLVNHSQLPNDALTGMGRAGGKEPMGGYQGRPGYGWRLPLIVISPWARENYVAHSLIDQTSILRFIEDNWQLGLIGDYSFDAIAGSMLGVFDFSKRRDRFLILDENTGKIVSRNP